MVTKSTILAALFLGTGLAACAEQIQTPTEGTRDAGIISAAGGRVDTHSRAYLVFADSVLTNGGWVPAGIRGDGRVKNGAAAGPGTPSNEYQGDFCGVKAVIGSLAHENGDMTFEVGATSSSCGAPRTLAMYGGGLTAPPTMVDAKTIVRGLYALAAGQSTSLWEGFGHLPANFSCGLVYFDDQYPPANSPKQTRLPDSTRSDGVVVRRWRVESQGSHQAACVTFNKNGSVQSVGPLYYLPFAITVVEVPYPYPTLP